MAANILVVEDEPAIQELIAVNLQHAGHHVMRAGDAEGALGLVRNALPDLLLIDWMLPGMSGVSLARQLRQEDRTRRMRRMREHLERHNVYRWGGKVLSELLKFDFPENV